MLENKFLVKGPYKPWLFKKDILAHYSFYAKQQHKPNCMTKNLSRKKKELNIKWQISSQSVFQN